MHQIWVLLQRTCTNNTGVSFSPAATANTRPARPALPPFRFQLLMASVSRKRSCSLLPLYTSLDTLLHVSRHPTQQIFHHCTMDLVQFGALPPIYIPVLTQPQPHPYPPQASGSYMQNGSGPVPGARPLLPDNGRVIQSGPTRVLCIADVRGKITRVKVKRGKSDKIKAICDL